MTSLPTVIPPGATGVPLAEGHLQAHEMLAGGSDTTYTWSAYGGTSWFPPTHDTYGGFLIPYGSPARILPITPVIAFPANIFLAMTGIVMFTVTPAGTSAPGTFVDSLTMYATPYLHDTDTNTDTQIGGAAAWTFPGVGKQGPNAWLDNQVPYFELYQFTNPMNAQLTLHCSATAGSGSGTFPAIYVNTVRVQQKYL